MKNQEEVWDNIAEEWNKVKRKQYPDFKEFIKNKKGKILDLGCGSGRNLINKKNLEFYEVDFSKNMLKFAKEKSKKENINAKFFISDLTELPFQKNFFDTAIFISVLHCINSNQKREQSLKELYRVLKPKAQVMISVWSRNNRRIKNKPKQSMIPWTVNNKKYFRYYYIYDKQELQALLKKIGFKIIKNWEDNNIVFIAEKP